VVVLCRCDLEPGREGVVFVALPVVVVEIRGRNILPLQTRHSWFQVDVRSCSHSNGNTYLCAIDSSVLWCIFCLTQAVSAKLGKKYVVERFKENSA
jgi:hypothetical protein